MSLGAVCLFLRFLSQPAPGRLRSVILPALFVGLTISTKYTALVLLPMAVCVMVFSHGRIPGRERVFRVLLFTGVCLLSFFLTNPYMLTDLDKAASDLRGEYLHQTRQNEEPPPPGLSRVLNPLRYGPGGMLGLLFCLVGVLRPNRRFSMGARGVLVSVPLLYLLPVLFSNAPFFRYTVPALPFVAVLAAHGIFVFASQRLERFRLLFLGAAVLACVVPDLITSFSIGRLLDREDTRTLAGKWIEEHVDPGVPVVVYGRPEQEPQLFESRASMQRHVEYMEKRYPRRRSSELLTEILRLQRDYLEDSDLPRYEVYRGLEELPPNTPEVCVVIPYYPLKNIGFSDMHVGRLKKAESKVKFCSLTADHQDYFIDTVDNFYLPFSHLDEVERPGPHFEILTLKGKGERQ
jgi:hypothetical protein